MSLREIDHIFRTTSNKDFTGCLMKSTLTAIMMRLNPLCLEDSPKGLGNIHVRAIWGQEEKKQASFHPYPSLFGHCSLSVNGSIVKHNDGRFGYAGENSSRKSARTSPVMESFRVKPIVSAIRRDHAENIEPVFFSGWHRQFSVSQMPAIRHISACTHMALITEPEIYISLFPEFYKFLQLLFLKVFSFTGMLSALIRMDLHRIRKRWHDPKRYAFSRAVRSSADNVSFGVFIVCSNICLCTPYRPQRPCHKLYF